MREVPDPAIQQPTDVALWVLRACIRGSDLWAHRGECARKPGEGFSPGRSGSGGASATRSSGSSRRPAPASKASPSATWPSPPSSGPTGPDGLLVKLPASDDRPLTALPALSDVPGTGHHAVVGAGVQLSGVIDPSPVFDLAIGLDDVPAGY